MSDQKWIAVKFSDDEHASIAAKAKEDDRSLAAHVRRVLLKHGAKK